MDASAFEVGKEELLKECEVAPQVFERVMPRLERFTKPFVDSLVRREQIEHAQTFLPGLLSDLEHKNAESIAYRFGEERMPLQWFLGTSGWDDEPLRDELVRQVGDQLDEEDGVIVFDPSAFPKKGIESVGVARQWCGRLGKVEICQVGIYMGYASSREHALVDMRLYLPKEWTKDRKRCKKAGIPKHIRYRTPCKRRVHPASSCDLFPLSLRPRPQEAAGAEAQLRYLRLSAPRASGLGKPRRYEETRRWGCKHPDGSRWKANGV